MLRLPIDERVSEIVANVREKNLVLVAEPGAGKTTRVPRAFLDAGLLVESRCVVLEPRRLATRMAARRVAEELSDGKFALKTRRRPRRVSRSSPKEF